MPKSISYPVWICNDCGIKYGAWYRDGDYIGPSSHCATYHVGRCDICKDENVAVTEPRDFGHLLDWDAIQKNIREHHNNGKKSRKTRKANAC